MACKKTVILTGTERKVEFRGRHCDIRNDCAGVIYVSCSPGVVADADGVLSIPPGQAVKYYGCRGVLYLLGDGKVLLCGNDYSSPVFRCAATSSGSGEGGVSQTYVDMQDADTLNKAKSYADGLVDNPNLLDNGDLTINQRGTTIYTLAYEGEIPTADRWALVLGGGSEEMGDMGMLNLKDAAKIFYGSAATPAYLVQRLDNPAKLKGRFLTLSISLALGSFDCWLIAQLKSTAGAVTVLAEQVASVDGKTSTTFEVPETVAAGDVLEVIVKADRECGFYYVKLEVGKTATPNPPTNTALETIKCQRYLLAISGYSRYVATRLTANEIDFFVPVPTTLKGTPKIDFNNLVVMAWDNTNATNVTEGFTFTIATTACNGIVIRATKTAHGVTAGYLEFKNKTTPFLLSCE